MAATASQEILASLGPALDTCNKCGFCMAGCPTYRLTQVEWMVTRGRVSMVQDALAGTLPLADIGPAVDTCLLCRACLDHCPSKVPIDLLMTRARAARRQEQPLPWLARFVLRQLLPRPGWLRAAARLGAVADSLGLRRWALARGLLRRWPTLERAARVGPVFPGTTARALIAASDLAPTAAPDGTARPGPGPEVRKSRGRRVAYFITCTRDVVMPAAARAAVRVLAAAGCQVVLPNLPCCGLPCQTTGDIAGARALARRQLDLLSGLDVDAIVIDDGSCAAHLKELPDLLRGLPEEGAARALAARCTDLASYLMAIGPPAAVRPIPARVTWHDPCHLKHYLKVAAAPRQLIQSVPGVTFVESADADVCCGGAGSFMLTQPDLSDRLLDLKCTAFAATGAELLVTSSPSCLMQLGRGAREQMPGMQVLSLAEFLERAYVSQVHAD